MQNVRGHAMFGTHPIYRPGSTTKYEITSTHHQMQYPFNLPSHCYSVIYQSQQRSDYYEGDKIGIVPCEPEVVLYHQDGKPNCLAIQGHPEMMRKEAPVIAMLNSLIDQLV